MNLDTRVVNCPYCNEPIELAFERVDGLQEYIEDCPVCCRPIEFELVTGNNQELLSLTTRRDDD